MDFTRGVFFVRLFSILRMCGGLLSRLVRARSESALRHAIILFPDMNGSSHNGWYVKFLCFSETAYVYYCPSQAKYHIYVDNFKLATHNHFDSC